MSEIELVNSISDMGKDDLQRNTVLQFWKRCNHLKRCRNNVATLFGAKNRRRESSRVTLP